MRSTSLQTLALVLLTIALTFSIATAGQHIPDRLNTYLRTNELMGQHPANIQEFRQMMAASAKKEAKAGWEIALHTDTITFNNSGISLPGSFVGGTQFFDFDGDGKLDIFLDGITGPTENDLVTKIYHNGESGFEDINAPFGTFMTEGGVAWGDYDNDGDYDLFVTGTSLAGNLAPIARIYRNVGGNFELDSTTFNFPGLVGNTATWVDYDNDGDLDLFYCGSPDNGMTFQTHLYHNDNGKFYDVVTPFAAVWGASVKWADYDNDGYLDVALFGYGDGGVRGEIYHNNGDGTFTNIHANVPPANSCAVEWFDFDNDGDLDLLLTGVMPANHPISEIYRNDGGGVFTPINAGLHNVCVSSVAVGDYDNDGYMDIALSGSESFFESLNLSTHIYHNNGNGTFTDINANLPGTWFGSMSFGDYDNDGRLDLLLCGNPWRDGPTYAPFTNIYHNDLSGSIARPIAPASASVVPGTNFATISWNAGTDARTATKALTYNVRIGTSPGSGDVLAPDANYANGRLRKVMQGNASRRTSKLIKKLKPGTYYYSVQTVNNGYGSSPFSTERQFVVGNPPVWRLVSAPLTESHTRTELYPDAVSTAFSFSGSYASTNVLQHGAGYWLKMKSASSPTVSAVSANLATDRIHLQAGWNLVGSVSASVPVASVVTDPPGIVGSNIFGYSSGYVVATSIDPCKGYWVRADAAGDLILNPSSAPAPGTVQKPDVNGMGSILVTDRAGNSQTLYYGSPAKSSAHTFELPPAPVAGAFDARFADQSFVANVKAGGRSELPIMVSSQNYPVTVTWQDAVGSAPTLKVGTHSVSLAQAGSAKINEGDVVALHVTDAPKLPEQFLLAQNYPNPFNPSTRIAFSLPVDSKVTLTVFNILGQAVQTVVDGVQTAGEHTVEMNASALSSGIYFYRLDAVGTQSPDQVYRETRKMAIIR